MGCGMRDAGCGVRWLAWWRAAPYRIGLRVRRRRLIGTVHQVPADGARDRGDPQSQLVLNLSVSSTSNGWGRS